MIGFPPRQQIWNFFFFFFKCWAVFSWLDRQDTSFPIFHLPTPSICLLANKKDNLNKNFPLFLYILALDLNLKELSSMYDIKWNESNHVEELLRRIEINHKCWAACNINRTFDSKIEGFPQKGIFEIYLKWDLAQKFICLTLKVIFETCSRSHHIAISSWNCTFQGSVHLLQSALIGRLLKLFVSNIQCPNV